MPMRRAARVMLKPWATVASNACLFVAVRFVRFAIGAAAYQGSGRRS
jgi:hypothetical protein